MSDFRDLAAEINGKSNDPTNDLRFRRGIVRSVNVNGTATVAVGGVDIAGVPYYRDIAGPNGLFTAGTVVDLLFDGPAPRIVGVVGAWEPGNRIGNYLVFRAPGTIGSNVAHTGGSMYSTTAISPPSRVVLASAWYRGNSGEAVPLAITAVDTQYVYLSIPGGLQGRGFNVNVVIDDTRDATGAFGMGGRIGWT